jgi:nucleotide-binding universal stress UspA family protein
MSVIVVGVDGSEESERALRFALDEARLRGAQLRVVHAWHMPPSVYAAPPVPIVYGRNEFEQGARSVLERALAAVAAETSGVEIEPVVVEDRAAPALLAAAAYADLLVIGSRGHGGFVGLLLGSVGQHCAHHARCPVVIVPHVERTAAEGAVGAPT